MATTFDDWDRPAAEYYARKRAAQAAAAAIGWPVVMLAARLIWCSYMMHTYDGFSAHDVPGVLT